MFEGLKADLAALLLAHKWKIRIAALCLAFAAGAFSCQAFGANLDVGWTNPTTRVDGSTLTPAELLGTRVERGSCSGGAFGTMAAELLAPAGATATRFINVPPGFHCVRAFARATDRANIAPFLESAASAVGTRTITDSPPNPPTGLTTAVTFAYQPYGPASSPRMRAVGTIDTGLPCYTDMVIVDRREDTYYRIDRDAIKIQVRALSPGPIYSKCA